MRLSDIWGSGLPFIPNPRSPEISSRGYSTGVYNSNGNPGSSTVTVIWGGSFANYTVIWSGNCSRSVNASCADLPRIPTCPRIARRCICEYLFHRRRQKLMWRQFNRGNPRFCLRRQIRDFSRCLATQYLLVPLSSCFDFYLTYL